MPNAWNLDDGLKLVRALQNDTRKYGYHLALGGGVLNNGESKKDIDLYFLPLDNNSMAKPDPKALIEWLVRMWGDFEPIGAEYDNADADPQPANLSYDVETQAPTFVSAFSLAEFIHPTPTVTPKPRDKGSYKYKLKFNRRGDRIDVFIL